MPRESTLERTTSETSIQLTLNLDGCGKSRISTGIPFFDHMLTLFSKHGLMDLDLTANGDIEDGSDDPVGTTAPSSPEVK